MLNLLRRTFIILIFVCSKEADVKLKNKMRKQLNIISTVIICGTILVSCGGGGGGSTSKVKKNQYLGSLPALYADYNAKKELHEAKIEEQGNKLMAGGEKNADKIMKLMKEDETTTKAMKEKLKADVSAEIAKMAGNEVPVSYSKALQNSNELFYQVAPAKLVANKDDVSIAILLSSKNDLEVPRMKGYDYSTYFRLIASDGSTIIKSVLLPVKLDTKPISFTAGEQLLENNFPVYMSNKPELYANFAGIEFITKDEYNESK